MRFEREQAFSAPVEHVVTVLRDPAFYPRLARLDHLGHAELLDEAQQGSVVRLAVRYRIEVDLPDLARAWVDADRLSLVEHAEIDLATGTGTFRMQPDHYADLLRCRGTYRYADLPDGSVRTMAGELSVRIPLLGSKVERVVMEGLEVALAGIVMTVDAYPPRSDAG